jgi:hypothetical protein
VTVLVRGVIPKFLTALHDSRNHTEPERIHLVHIRAAGERVGLNRCRAADSPDSDR